MLKKGFTLAEVLITLGVVGVIAALTLPSLSLNIQKQQVGPSLAKAVNVLENANKLYLQRDDIPNLTSCGTTYPKCLVDAGILAATTESTAVPASFNKKYSGENLDLSGYNMYITKDGFTYYMKKEISGSIEDRAWANGYMGRYYLTYIDINGLTNQPNKLGKDIFCFYVDGYGAVLPYGSLIWHSAQGIRSNLALRSTSWEQKCTRDKAPTDDGSACAGSIADNGWNVLYKY